MVGGGQGVGNCELVGLYTRTCIYTCTHMHACTYIEFTRLSSGGGSMKSNSNKLSTPRDFSSSTTLPKFVRMISGTVLSSISNL